MYLNIVSLPSFSPTWAHQVLTEFVRAVVMSMSPNCSPAGVRERHPVDRLIGERPLSTEPGVNWPLSSAAVAVTTFIVEPGGYPAWVARLKSGARVVGVEALEGPFEFWTEFGSYSGMLTIALISPVEGTIATTDSAPAREAVHGGALGRRVERGLHLVPHLGVALELVENGEELGLVPDQLVVVGELEADPTTVDEAVADRVAEQRALRVVADVDLVVALPDRRRVGDHRAVVGDDVAALDLLLLEQRPCGWRCSPSASSTSKTDQYEVKPKSSA